MSMHVAIFSSYARDTIVVGGQTKVEDRGPARYLTDTLTRLGVPHRVYAGARPADVRIDVVDGVECGRIERVDPIPVPTPLTADASIVSTLLDEFPIDRLPDLPGLIALDVQGFVRNPGGGRRVWSLDPAAWPSLDIVKAAEYEVPFLADAFIQSQQQRILLITRGARGATLWDHGAPHDIAAEPVDAPHALGAGDAFLAAFVVERLRGMAAPDAGRFAAQVVHDMLMERTVPSQGGAP